MTNYLLSIDPGWSTGVALLTWSDDRAASLVAAWQFSGGLTRLGDWLDENGRDSEGRYQHFEPLPYLLPAGDVTWISEKFTPRPNEKFGLTLRSVEPLRCEGVLVDRGLLPDYDPKVKEWRQPALQYIAGGKDKTDKKKRLHRFLKDSGYYVTGSQIDSPDADDARSAIGHGLSYLIREVKHKPTFQVLSEWSERG